MNDVNRITFSKANYHSDDEFYDKLAQQLRLLCETRCLVVIRDYGESSNGEFVVEFMECKGDYKPFWLSKNEMMAAFDEHVNEEVDNAQRTLTASRLANNAKDDLEAMFGIKKKDDDDDDGSGNNAA